MKVEPVFDKRQAWLHHPFTVQTTSIYTAQRLRQNPSQRRNQLTDSKMLWRVYKTSASHDTSSADLPQQFLLWLGSLEVTNYRFLQLLTCVRKPFDTCQKRFRHVSKGFRLIICWITSTYVAQENECNSNKRFLQASDYKPFTVNCWVSYGYRLVKGFFKIKNIHKSSLHFSFSTPYLYSRLSEVRGS